MKYLILAVFLAVVQAAPPVPRKTPDQPAASGKHITQNTKANKAPPKTPPPASDTANNDEDKRHSPAQGDANETVVISESAPVTNGKDRWDKAYVIFNGLLVLIGSVGVCAAYRTLKAIENQARVMGEQREVMSGQMRSMQDQITEMSVQSGILQESVGISRETAKAAQDGANAAKQSADATNASVEMIIKKERARLRVDISQLVLPDTPSPDSPPRVDFTVSISGTTDAFITDSRCAAYVVPPEWIEYAELSEAMMFQVHGLPSAVTANHVPWECYAFWGLSSDLNDAVLVAEIRAKRMLVGIRGIIKYKDVFDRERHTSFRYKWKYFEWNGVGEEGGDWIKCGATTENEET